jgi:hypothetical protein
VLKELITSNWSDDERKQYMAASKAHEKFTSHYPGGYAGLFVHGRKDDVKVWVGPNHEPLHRELCLNVLALTLF